MRLRRFLRGSPQSRQLLLGVFRQGLARRLLHAAEPGVKLVAGHVQSLLRIHAGHLRDFGGDEKQIAQLLLYAVGQVLSLIHN